MASRSPRSPIQSETDARHCFEEAAAAGVSLYSWGRANGISTTVLYRWRNKLGRTITAPTPRLVELCAPAKRPMAAPPQQPASSSGTAMSGSSARYSLALHDVTIVLGDDFTEATLSRLLRVVRAC